MPSSIDVIIHAMSRIVNGKKSCDNVISEILKLGNKKINLEDNSNITLILFIFCLQGELTDMDEWEKLLDRHNVDDQATFFFHAIQYLGTHHTIRYIHSPNKDAFLIEKMSEMSLSLSNEVIYQLIYTLLNPDPKGFLLTEQNFGYLSCAFEDYISSNFVHDEKMLSSLLGFMKNARNNKIYDLFCDRFNLNNCNGDLYFVDNSDLFTHLRTIKDKNSKEEFLENFFNHGDFGEESEWESFFNSKKVFLKKASVFRNEARDRAHVSCLLNQCRGASCSIKAEFAATFLMKDKNGNIIPDDILDHILGSFNIMGKIEKYRSLILDSFDGDYPERQERICCLIDN